MNRIHIYTAALLLSATATVAEAQEVRTGYFNESFIYRHQLNPAFGNDENYFSIPMLGNVNMAMNGNFGYEELVRPNPLYPQQSNKKMTSFLNPYLENGLAGFASGENKVSGQALVSVFSAGFKKWGGYNTIELNTRAYVNVHAPFQLFDFAANATNRKYDIGDVGVDAQTFGELAVGHSRDIDERLRVGAKAKVLIGIANASVRMDNVVADLSDANQWIVKADAKAQVSMGGFEYVSKAKEYNSRQGTYEYVSDVDMGTPGIAGVGLAVDAGASYKVNDDLTVSAALQDLGAILWTSNHKAVNMDKEFVFDGFHDVEVNSQTHEVLDDKADRYADQMLDFANLRDQGDQGSRVTGIGATVSAGLQYTIPTYRSLRIGLLGTSRINGPYTWTEGRLSGNIAPVDWFEGSLSFAVNSFGFNTGFMANFKTKGFNFFLGMDAIVGKVSKEFIPLNSNGGVSLGFNILL